MVPDWIEAICAILGIFLAFWGIIISLPKITKKVNDISEKISIPKRRFDTCRNCPFENVCVSPFIEDVGDFDKINEIDNKEISDWIVNLYNEIKRYEFGGIGKYYGSKEHQECLLRKLTIAINLIGSSNMAFNRIKDEKEKK
ncbi:MAG: hypothetical protein LBC76_06540 [Treponema sp.]|jgi:hypothetical protein|nr:hypothetical protein [Treponema sp.]